MSGDRVRVVDVGLVDELVVAADTCFEAGYFNLVAVFLGGLLRRDKGKRLVILVLL